MKKDTLCIHATPIENNPTRAINIPIYQTAAFSHPGIGQSAGYDYSRQQNPTREHLEKIVATLENGYDAMAFSSGMAAIAMVMELFSPGDHLIVSNDLYGGSYRLFETVSAKNGLLFTKIDTGDLAAVKASIKENTKAIYIETPTNPMMQVTDIAAAAAVAKAHNLLVIVDNTVLTPYFQQPLNLGADLVVHSGTKYLSGHNDTLAGFLVVNDRELSDKLRFLYKTVGYCLAPFDSWLLIRGIKTLALRLEKQQASALRIANWLKANPHVSKVYYIGLPEHPSYEVSRQQTSGFGSIISFTVDTEATARKIFDRIRLIVFAESFGGAETLLTYPMLQTHADVPQAAREALGIDERLLRLSVGIENPDDIIADLEQAFTN